MIDIVCGARPNFMKVAPILASLGREVGTRLVHTGQHYDYRMSGSFFEELGLPRPDIDLEVGPGSITVQTAKIMERYERVLGEQRPDVTVVVGDVTSTLACSLAAVRSSVPVAHVEAGLRSFDRTMPEELNRVLTDQLAELLLITSQEARDNLLAEGRPEGAILMVGNPMIDTLLRLLPEARSRARKPGAEPYALVTLHRPSNVDDPGRLKRTVEELEGLEGLRVLFPVHPRTRERLESLGIGTGDGGGMELMDPLPYLEFVALEEGAAVVVTDSGGVQEETTVMGVPCVTLRPNTERPVTLELGTNELCPEPEGLPDAVERRIAERPEVPPQVPMWDGRAGERIAEALLELTGGRR